jgi:hypothetical protein
MGMAANPSGAHQAGRVFAGRIRLRRRVSVQRRRTLARLLEADPVLTNFNKITSLAHHLRPALAYQRP